MKSKQLLSRFFFSFPAQLVLLHFKKNQVMMLFWLLLFGFITESFATRFGIPYLFLDPEYTGKVGFWSFFIVGLCTGAFIMAFNISSFILNSFRFPFLATLSRTFAKYCHNNFVIPAAFVGLYCYRIFEFQRMEQMKSELEVMTFLLAFLSGIVLVVLVTLRYFMATNKDIYKLFGVKHADAEDVLPGRPLGGLLQRKNWKVETYLVFPFRVKLVRDARHYKRYMLDRVFRQNHINAAVVEIIVFITFIALGLFRDYPLFRIPAGGSVLLLMTMLLMLSGVFKFWIRAWANTALILLFLFINFISQFEFFVPRSKAYGLDYTSTPALYDRQHLEAQVKDSLLLHDIIHTTAILENWKKNQVTQGAVKPKLVLLNVSGGGLRSSVFTFRTLQVIDSIYQGGLFRQTAFATGSSGGMISLCYYRELYLNHYDTLMAANQNQDNRFLQNMGKDLLNSVAFSATVADLFMNNQKFSDGAKYYEKDRAWAWEQQLLENTGHILEKRMCEYRKPEEQARIPILVLCPTVVNDGKALVIAAQPTSYLLHKNEPGNGQMRAECNGIEFMRYFQRQHADSLKLSSALRMNSAFPYVMPAVSLPSTPTIEVMDAGIRDNYGVMNSVQFLHTFREWIAENTSGVVFLQIRDTYKHSKVEDNSIRSFVEKILTPMRNVSGNFLIMQDYNFDRYLQYAKSWLEVPLDVITFQIPESDDRISLSWHLTETEKKFLKNAALNPENRAALQRLKEILPTAITRPQASARLPQNGASAENSIQEQ